MSKDEKVQTNHGISSKPLQRLGVFNAPRLEKGSVIDIENPVFTAPLEEEDETIRFQGKTGNMIDLFEHQDELPENKKPGAIVFETGTYYEDSDTSAEVWPTVKGQFEIVEEKWMPLEVAKHIMVHVWVARQLRRETHTGQRDWLGGRISYEELGAAVEEGLGGGEEDW